ncbi:hypothetical protein TUSST3_53770 [Streptomyces sp. TUS-ST3]|uniref:hypothetical protein n=1 Tax=Streptomyces sp. TUS-ST3 TaxID=3025591 RepID=UPI00235B43D3|nr:hypothetical protein [Streptomyces sp. TUS-ST3]GLP68754.1 hypothetical protein TUSST3_53770 [Streptomyces sp. TUS-ST3]
MRVHPAGFTERPITFGYNFRMRCESCDHASTLSGADYVRLEAENHALMECTRCHRPTRFGPLASAIRHENDPVLDDGVLNNVIWYHTSPYADWPSKNYEHDQRVLIAASRIQGWGDTEHTLQVLLGKALHLGTYEAAIENMYRRMRNQNDAQTAFFLHRVRISVDPARINPGYRDERDEAAADISIAQLDDDGLDAVRYLNVWEALGSISLAVRPSVITDIHTVAIPNVLGPVDNLPSPLAGLIKDLERKNEMPAPPEERELRSYTLTEELEDALIAHFLPEVNLQVAHEFAQAVARAHGRIGSGFREHARLFAEHARLLSAPGRVLDLLNAAPRRQLT